MEALKLGLYCVNLGLVLYNAYKGDYQMATYFLGWAIIIKLS